MPDRPTKKDQTVAGVKLTTSSPTGHEELAEHGASETLGASTNKRQTHKKLEVPKKGNNEPPNTNPKHPHPVPKGPERQ